MQMLQINIYYEKYANVHIQMDTECKPMENMSKSKRRHNQNPGE